MEGLLTEGGKYLVTQGVLGILVVGLSVVVVVLYRQLSAARAECDKVAETGRAREADLYDKRLDEALVLMQTVAKVTGAMEGLGRGMEERARSYSEAMTGLTTTIARMSDSLKEMQAWDSQRSSDLQTWQATWRERFGALERSIAEISKSMVIVQHRVTGRRDE